MKKYDSNKINLMLTVGYINDAQNVLNKINLSEKDLEEALRSLNIAFDYIVAQRQSLKAHLKQAERDKS